MIYFYGIQRENIDRYICIVVCEAMVGDYLNFNFQYCAVSIIPDLPMSFGGTTDPCAIANLMSIGGLGVELNKKHAKVLFDLVEMELGIPSDRMYITFQNAPTSDVGYKGTTFHEIFG
ncbi:unnamed protein product [Diatraea saccharalis]|uniref:L-dopachrome isomerase n=1 Tax=Diatraea saccharalis TaxID=40085 RepID=A0A9P0CBW4_9NEOP|nr:unnamed protein product [Diatraea saccharalis]